MVARDPAWSAVAVRVVEALPGTSATEGPLPDEGEVVGNEDQGHPDFVLEADEELEDLAAHRGVEHRDGLIGDKRPGFERYGGRDDPPLVLSTR